MPWSAGSEAATKFSGHWPGPWSAGTGAGPGIGAGGPASVSRGPGPTTMGRCGFDGSYRVRCAVGRRDEPCERSGPSLVQ